jgi:putative salt-induced outer membrane protein
MKLVRHAGIACLAGLAAPAFAQDAPPPEWSGEGAFNAGFTTGNTETTDLGVALKLKHQGDNWIQSGELLADYGETDDVESRNRLFAAGQIDRIFDDRLSGYGRLTWERDEFSGFDNRWFAGLGMAWKAIDGDVTKWTIEGGPGYKIDEVRATLTDPASTEESIGARAGSKFEHKFNDAVTLSNTTEAVYSQASTQLLNVVALTANVWGNLSARVSLDVRHDTDPLEGFEATDTATKFSLVYKVN